VSASGDNAVYGVCDDLHYCERLEQIVAYAWGGGLLMKDYNLPDTTEIFVREG
jgi:uncharacterized protein YrrD